jgi:hypothetical protein
MALVDVSASPLFVVVDLYSAVLNAGVTQNSQYVHTEDTLNNVPPSVLGALGAQFAPILNVLNTPVGNLLNTAWKAQQSSVESYMATQFASAASGTGNVTITNVSCSLPPTGTVLADDFEATSSGGVTQNTLEIDFHLPGGSVNFTTPYTVQVWPWPGGTETFYPTWNVSFDADLSLFTVVPTQPFNLTPSAAVTLSNANGPNPTNFVAAAADIVDNIWVGLVNFFEQGNNYISQIGEIQQQVAQQADQTQPVANTVIAPMLTLFNELNSAGPECVALGFTQCAFSVGPYFAPSPPNSVVLRITHPLDQGPTIVDGNNPPGIIQNDPTLATAPEATPGSTITAVGSDFPADTTTSLSLEFPNTSSGTPTGAQVQFNGQIYDVPVPPTPAPYAFNPTGLASDNIYVFEARCGDQATWSQWGPQFSLATASGDFASLELWPVDGGQYSYLGHAPLQPANTPWTCLGNIDPNTPTGPYLLKALAAGGAVIAKTPLQIVTTLTPTLGIVGPNNTSVPYPRSSGIPFTLAGYGFPDGPVTISFNGTQVAPATASNANPSNPSFSVNLTTPGNPASNETVNVTATDGGITATLNPAIYLQGTQ